jgi:hypothetical protein
MCRACTEVLESVGDLGVAFVVDPHEAELDQATTQCDLGVDDLAGVGEFHGEWLLGEDRHAAFETGHHVSMVKAIGTGDDERIDLIDAIHALGNPLATQFVRERLPDVRRRGRRPRRVRHRRDPRHGGHDRPPCRRHR